MSSVRVTNLWEVGDYSWGLALVIVMLYVIMLIEVFGVARIVDAIEAQECACVAGE